LLNVRPDEATPFLYLQLHAFLSGFGIAISFIAINALAISKGIEKIPLWLIFTSLLLLGGGLVYTKIEHKLGAFKAFSTVLIVCMVWAFASGFSMLGGATLPLIGIAFVTYWLAYLLTNLEFWGAVAIIFDVRQGKRLFGPLAVGESIAKLIGYTLLYEFLKGYLVESFLIAGVCFFLSWLTLRAITKKYGHIAHHDDHSHGHTEEHGSLSFFTPSKVIKTLKNTGFSGAIAIFTMLTTLIVFLIYYSYSSEVNYQIKGKEKDKKEQVYKDGNQAKGEDIYTAEKDAVAAGGQKSGSGRSESAVAEFLAFILIISRVGNILFKGFFTGRILNYFGVGVALIILPLCILLVNLFGAGFQLFYLDSTDHTFLLYLFIVAYIFDESLRTSLFKPSFLILFQPLAQNKRLEAHTLAKGIMEPIGMGLAGLCLVLAYHFGIIGKEDKSALVYMICALALLWVIMSSKVGKVYKGMLSNALKNRIFDRGAMRISREEKQQIRRSKLNSSDPLELLYAVRLLKDELTIVEKEDAVRKIMDSGHHQYMQEGLSLITELKLESFEPVLLEMIMSDNEELVREATMCYTAIKGEESVPVLEELKENGAIRHPDAILAGVLKNSGIFGAVSMGEEYLKLLRSEVPEHRVEAAEILMEIGDPKYFYPVQTLLEDPSVEVKKAAIRAAGEVRNPKLLPFLLKNATNVRLFGEILRIIGQYGSDAQNEIKKHYEEVSFESKLRYLRLCSRLRGEKTLEFLLQRIGENSQRIRHEAIQSLYFLKFQANTQEERRKIEAALDVNTKVIRILIEADEIDMKGDLLGDAIRNEIVHVMFPQTMYLLSFLYERNTITNIMENTLIGTGDYRSNALELLETHLRIKDSRKILPLIENIFERMKAPVDSDISGQFANQAVETLFTIPDLMISEWLIAIAIRVARTQGMILKSSTLKNIEACRDQIAVDQEAGEYISIFAAH
jgi:hypothetical protein